MINKIIILLIMVTMIIITDKTVNGITSASNVCAGHSHGTFIRNIQNCSTYFICFNGQPLLSECPEDKQFNYLTRNCELPENVDCFNCPENINFIDLYIPNECNQFARCFRGAPEQLTCSDGLLFDRQLEMCNLQEHVTCPFQVICPRNGLSFIRDRDNCNKFFKCINGNLTEQFCPSNLYFNTDTLMCDLPVNINKGCKPLENDDSGNGSDDDNDDDDDDDDDDEENDDETTAETTEEIPIETTTELPLRPLYPCPGMGNGPMYPHLQDCSQFYFCIGGVPIMHQCDGDKYFDYIYQYCGNKNDVNCYR